MDFRIGLIGKKQVEIEIKGFRIKTDQPIADGGDASAPSPFDLFIASIGTCAGFFIQSYCQARAISTEGLELIAHVERDEVKHLVSKISIEIVMPSDFPEKHRLGLISAVNACTVKKHLQNPPIIEAFTRSI